MWDLQGKALGVPCYQLFGGKLRDETRNYANINRMTRGDERTPEGFAHNAQRAVDAGFDAFKLAPFDHMRAEEADPERYKRDSDLGVRMAEAVRDVVGPERDLLLDAHSRFSLDQARDVGRRLEGLNLFWLEEVARSTDILAAFNREAKMPTAGGESLFGVREFFPYLKAGAVDIVMPDMKFCGGMYELKKIAAMAGASGVQTSPHGPASPIGNMAATHVCVTMPNFQLLEFAFGEVPWRAECVEPAESIVNGRLKVLETPGIGYELASDRWQKFAG
jgi:galactonate dehydratase